MNIEHYFRQGKRFWFCLHGKDASTMLALGAAGGRTARILFVSAVFRARTIAVSAFKAARKYALNVGATRNEFLTEGFHESSS